MSRLTPPAPAWSTTTWQKWSFPGAAAIDVGSGEGRQAVELSRRSGLQVTGIDPVPQRADTVRDRALPGDTVSFRAGTAEDLPVPSGSADLIW